MARALRIEYPGAWYHVTCRGNERGVIFQDDKDRGLFIQSLGESIEALNVELHYYVLMSNHFHLLVKTPDGNLGRFMQRFNTTYITRYNSRHHRSGHLYQGRYKAVLVDSDEYLLELSRYIHLNPVRLKKYKRKNVVEKMKILKSYKWSSFSGYINLKDRCDFVNYKAVLFSVGRDDRKGRKEYSKFVQDGLMKGLESPLKDVKGQTILGTESFISWVNEKFIDPKKIRNKKDYPQVKNLLGNIKIKDIANAVAREYGATSKEILEPRSTWREARKVLLEICYKLKFSRLNCKELGRQLGGIGGDAVAHNHKRFQKTMERDKKLSKKIVRIYANLSQ